MEEKEIIVEDLIIIGETVDTKEPYISIAEGLGKEEAISLLLNAIAILEDDEEL
ncbi:hypothetical protein AAXB25_14270 [Paenibacillus lautus]|uniref:hypothetical protein n=1 Tax=Paenibacillus lautus TaxID=1401 RepID=UPI003D297C07